MLVVSLAAGLVPFDPGRVVALRSVSQATFKRPVRFGDTLHVEGRIADLTPGSEDAGLVTFGWSVVNQDDRCVCRARVDVLWRRDEMAEVEIDTAARDDFVPIPL
jgi:3-hydroxybutyryl-CoA dehydratase